MAFDKYKNSAWMEPEDTVKRYEASAWTEADTAKRYKNSAWEEVWANTKLLEFTHTMSVACMIANDKWDDDIYMWAEDDGGYMLFYIEGNFVNPTISFVYEGGLMRILANGNAQYLEAATISTYTTTSSGSISEGNTVKVGSSSGFTDPTQASFTLNGTFTKVGIKVKFHNWNISPDSTGFPVNYTAYLSYILIDGQKYKADPNDTFDYLT